MKILAGIVLFVIAGALIVPRLINNAVAEFYSPEWVSESISEARTNDVFVSRPTLRNTSIRWGKSDYSIQEVWIEKATRIKYDLVFFRRVIPTGYRLVLKIKPTGQPLGRSFSDLGVGGEELLVCNNSIQIGGTTGDNLWYTEISPPMPRSIQCAVKKLH